MVPLLWGLVTFMASPPQLCKSSHSLSFVFCPPPHSKAIFPFYLGAIEGWHLTATGTVSA